MAPTSTVHVITSRETVQIHGRSSFIIRCTCGRTFRQQSQRAVERQYNRHVLAVIEANRNGGRDVLAVHTGSMA